MLGHSNYKTEQEALLVCEAIVALGYKAKVRYNDSYVEHIWTVYVEELAYKNGSQPSRGESV